MKKTLNIDSNIFIFIRYFSFSIASAISILLNIFFFQALDTGGYYWILFGISILLESAKVSTILTRNVFSSLYIKLQKKRIQLAKSFFLCLYITLAVLSIMSAAGFSYYVTETTDTIKEIEVANLQNKIEIMESIRDRIESFADERDVTLSEYSPYIRANEFFEERNRIFLEANDRWTRLNTRFRSTDPDDDLYLQLQRETNAAWTERANLNVQMIAARDARQRAINEFNDRGTNVEERMNELDAEFNMMVRELDLTAPGLDLPLISRARLVTRELIQELGLLEDRILKEKGMQIIFDDMGALFGIEPKMIKLIILLFVAILIELTIFQTAPDIKVNRKVLYYFRNWIPNDVDINELLGKFDKELERFDENFKPEESPKQFEQQVVMRKKRIKREKIIQPTPTVTNVTQPSNEKETLPSLPPVSKERLEKFFNDDEKKEETEYTKSLQEELRNKEIITPVEVVPETIKVNRVKVEPTIYTDNKTIRYRFGRTTEVIANKLCDFIRLCINEAGPFIQYPEKAAEQLGLSRKAKDVFLEHMSNLKLKSKPLITRNQLNEYYANYSADEIIKYATEIIDE